MSVMRRAVVVGLALVLGLSTWPAKVGAQSAPLKVKVLRAGQVLQLTGKVP